MTRTTIATAVTASALAAALLSGCGGGQPAAGSSSMPNVAPAPSSATSSSAPATSSPTSSKPSRSVEMAGAPGVPKPARMHTKAGAEAFVRHYVYLINETGLEPRTGRLAPLATGQCKTCHRYESSVDYMIEHRLHYSGPVFQVENLHALKQGAAAMRVAADLTQLPMKVLRTDGSTFQETIREPTYFTFILNWTNGGGWRADKIYGSEQ